LDKAPNDTSSTPAASRNRVRRRRRTGADALLREGSGRPELFGFLEVTLPTQTNKVLIGTGLGRAPGFGIVRAFPWGTMTTRITVEYNHDDRLWDLGEFSIEYLKRLSPACG